MGVYLKPCHGCPIPKLTKDADCAQKRSEMKSKVCRSGLSSATFKCHVLARHFRPGRRITINTPILKYGRYDDDGFITSWKEVKATVLAFDGHKFQCVVDLDSLEEALTESVEERQRPASDFIYRKPIPARRIVRFLDEPDGLLCRGGNVATDDEKCDRLTCHECHPVDYDGWL